MLRKFQVKVRKYFKKSDYYYFMENVKMLDLTTASSSQSYIFVTPLMYDKV